MMTMKQVPPLFTWLGLAALADWLVTRTLARAAIFMPKPEAVLSVYQGIGFLGQAAASLTSLLAFLALGWIAVGQLRGWLVFRNQLPRRNALLGNEGRQRFAPMPGRTDGPPNEYGVNKMGLAFGVTCLGLILISLLSLFIPSAGWLALSFQTLICAAILLLAWQT